jgi:hypothetical protein
VGGRVLEVSIRRQQLEAPIDAQAGEQGIDRPQLNALASARVAKRRCLDMVIACGDDEWQRLEPRNESGTLLGASQALEELLQDQAGRVDLLAVLEAATQSRDCRGIRGHVTPQREGPDTRVDEDQRRDRSAL